MVGNGSASDRDSAAKAVRTALAGGTGAVIALGLIGEIVHALAPGERVDEVAALLSLSFEQNLPTWYASMLLFSCCLLLAAIARQAGRAGDPYRRYWWALCAGFAAMSIDEVAELHERLGGWFGGSGLLYFDWVVPAGIAVMVIGLAFIPFLRRLPAESRRAFVVAGAVYLAGGLAMELPLGAWTERAGGDNLVYGLLDFVEEALELTGASLFALALWRHRAGAVAEAA